VRLDDLEQELAELARTVEALARDLPRDVGKGASTGDWGDAQDTVDALAKGVARAGELQAEIDDLKP
jgi:hypothetical protein